MSDATISLLILAAVVAAFVWNRLPVEFVAISSALALYFTGVLDLRDALAGFGDPAVILIAALFVVSEGLDATGVTTWVGQTLVAKAGDGVGRLLLLTMLLSAGLTALIGLNGTVAALLPMTVVIAMRRSLPPSRLLMPLAFAGSAGGLLLLTGSPVNVVISEAAQAAGVGSFGFAEFAVVGVPVVLGTLLIVWAFGQRLLPDRVSDELPPDLSGHASILVRQYSLDHVAHLRVLTGSPMIGSPRAAIDLTEYSGTRLVTVMDAESWQPASAGAIHPGDRLTLVGDPDTSARFAADHGLEVENVRTGAQVEQSLMGKEMGAAEVVIPPRSRYVGRPVRPSQVIRDRIVVLAVERSGKDLGSGLARLAAGDVLLVEGSWPALDEAARDHDLLVVDSPALVRRQAVPLGAGSIPAIGVLAAMVVLLATGLVPPVVAALLAAGAMILFRAVTVQQAGEAGMK